MQITSMKSHRCGDLREKNVNEQVKLSGWVSTIRDLGGIIFCELRDRSGFFQVVADPQVNPEVHKVFSTLKSEYVITVEGKVSTRPTETYNPKYPTGEVEMYPEKITILSKAETLPFVIEDD